MPEKFNPSRTVRARRTSFATRDGADGFAPQISGYFVVFNEPYYIDETMEEVVMPGAFDHCDTSDVRALTDHLTHLVLGRANDHVSTLRFSIDEKGIPAEIDINAADLDAMNLYARTQRGDVDQASFGFDESDVRYRDLPDGRVRREIWGISKLWELSVCTFPAYEQTLVYPSRARFAEECAAFRAQAEAQRKAAAARQKEALLKKFKHPKGA